MTRFEDALRRSLRAFGASTENADLLARSLAASRRLRRTRALAAATASAVVVAGIGVGAWAITTPGHDGSLPAITSPTHSSTPAVGPTVSPSGSRPPGPSASSTKAQGSTPPPSGVALPITLAPAPTGVAEAMENASSILQPTSCVWTGNVVTATGTYRGGLAGEGFLRVGSIINLYVFSAPFDGSSTGEQLAFVGPSNAVLVQGEGPWRVSVTIQTPPGVSPVRCAVQVFPTHDPEGAPNAYGP